MITQREFRNALIVLRNVDSHQIKPPLTALEWAIFSSNPIEFYLRSDYETQAAIWTAAERRLKEAEGIRA